ncbi:MAG: transcriptional regulator [Sphingomonadales bacterium 63-6]|nr:MAG: transcriptional regulator [Sphingomonadales bacterium 63-6]
MSGGGVSQREQLRTLIAEHGILRAQDIRDHGIAGTTIQRALEEGDLIRISRGLYQDPHVEIDSDLTLAEIAKRVPKGVIAMVSALAWHGLTDQMPRKTWVAIGVGDWAPAQGYPPIRIVRFADKYLTQGVERHRISGVEVPIYSVAKTLADLFRNARLVDRSIAVEGLRSALEQRKASPAEIAEAARAGGAWSIMRPYLEALTFNG